MYCSNEVILIDTSCARYTKKSRFYDIDMTDVGGIFHKSNSVSKQHFSTIHQRLFKIIDVKYVVSEILKENPFPMGVLIEREFDGLRIVCRAKDLLYTDSRLCTIDFLSDEDEGASNYYTLLGNPARAISDVHDYTHRLMMAEETRLDNVFSFLHKELWDMWGRRLFVDKTDSRRTEKRTFLHRNNSSFITRLFKVTNDCIRQFYKCSSCNTIDIQHKKLRDKYYCNRCVKDKVDNCDVCRDTFPIIELGGSEKSNDSRVTSEVLDTILSSVNVEICCKMCLHYCYYMCSRCSKVEYIDFDLLIGKKIDEKTRIYDEFKKDINRMDINNKKYCSKCSTLKITTILERPYKFHGLPIAHHGKSEFTRFVGIESEVITNYDDTEYYLEDGDIPEFFEAVEDGSLSSCGVEFRTHVPVIGTNVDKALESLENVNRYEDNFIDNTCGVHIHMNAIDFNFIEIQSILMIMSRLQHVIYDSLPSDRTGNTYCKEIRMLPEKIASIKTLPELINTYYSLANTNIDDNKYNDARYFGTNIHARFILGSIEFRYHEGEIYSSPIRDWIRFLNRIMDKSTTLSSNKNLYNKIISSKTLDIDILQEVCGDWGVDYIENKTENKYQ